MIAGCGPTAPAREAIATRSSAQDSRTIRLIAEQGLALAMTPIPTDKVYDQAFFGDDIILTQAISDWLALNNGKIKVVGIKIETETKQEVTICYRTIPTKPPSTH